MTNFEPTVLFGIILALLVLTILWTIRLEIRLKKLLGGKKNQSLEESLLSFKDTEEAFHSFRSHIEGVIEHMNKRLQKSIKHVDTMRFDAFKDGATGGGQSFATAFMDEDGNGVVISTLHTRDRVGVFSKPLKNGTSEYELTDEERSVIENARKS